MQHDAFRSLSPDSLEKPWPQRPDLHLVRRRRPRHPARFYAETFSRQPRRRRDARARRLRNGKRGRRADGRVQRDGHSLRRPELRGPAFKRTKRSFMVATDDQAETDRLWNAIVGNGGPGERATAAGARTAGACRGRSRRARLTDRWPARPGRRQARVRRDDDHAQDRHRHHQAARRGWKRSATTRCCASGSRSWRRRSGGRWMRRSTASSPALCRAACAGRAPSYFRVAP